MQNHLYISNFKKHNIILCFLFALLTFVILYTPIRKYLIHWQAENGYDISDDVAMFLSGNDYPVIVIAGSSRNGMSVHEDIIENAFLVECVKLPINASTSYEILQLMQIHPKRFSKTKLLVIDLEPYQFNKNCPTVNQSGKTLNAFDNIFPKIDIKGILQLLKGGKKFHRMDSRWSQYAEEPDNGGDRMMPINAADRFFYNFDYNQEAERHLVTLIKLCKEMNIEILINIPPAQWKHIEYIKQNYAVAYQEFLNILKRIKFPGVHFSVAETFPSYFGKDKDLFIDYGHMQEQGAVKYTKFLVKEIKSNQALEMDWAKPCRF